MKELEKIKKLANKNNLTVAECRYDYQRYNTFSEVLYCREILLQVFDRKGKSHTINEIDYKSIKTKIKEIVNG